MPAEVVWPAAFMPSAMAVAPAAVMPSAMAVAPATVAVPRAVTGVPPATPGQVIPAVRCPLAPALHVAVAPPAGGERVGAVSGLLGGPAGRAGAACRRHGAARLE